MPTDLLPITGKSHSPTKVCAVVTTYNRLELLKLALAAIRTQTRPPDAILVIDNGSTDETNRWLVAESANGPRGALQLITQPNLGSSGGIFTGLNEAFAAGHDWFWVLDDDTIPSSNALEMLLSGAARYQASHPERRIGWLNSIVLWSDGSLHRMNEPKLKPFLKWNPRFLTERYLPAEWCSFVSVLLTREAVAECGLPIKDMFIWYDDVEYTARIELRGFSGLVVPDSVVEHRTKLNYTPELKDINAENYSRFRHTFRNQVLALRTLYQGRPWALFIRFIRLMLRRTYLMLKARKFRYVIPAIFHSFKGLFMKRCIDFPSSGAGDGAVSHSEPTGTLAKTSAHVSQA